MTEKEAWLYLAASWTHPVAAYGDRVVANVGLVGRPGLCPCIKTMWGQRLISVRVMQNMLDRVRDHQPGYFGYLWPQTLEGAVSRSEFCKTQAERLQ